MLKIPILYTSCVSWQIKFVVKSYKLPENSPESRENIQKGLGFKVNLFENFTSTLAKNRFWDFLNLHIKDPNFQISKKCLVFCLEIMLYDFFIHVLHFLKKKSNKCT